MANVGFATLQVVPSMLGVQQALSGQISGPAQAAGASAGTVFGGGFGGALRGGLLAGGAVVAVGGLLAGVGAKFDEAFDHIRTETGATGEELDGLKDIFRGVVADVPTDFGSAAEAVAGLEQRLDLTGPQLENLAEQVLHLTNLTGDDLGQTINSTTRLFGDWGVATEDQSGTLDMLFRASQATGVGINDLADRVVQFGSPLRLLGFSLQDSVALLGGFEEQGVNVSTVMSGMRQAVAKFAQDGREPMEGMAWVMDQVAQGTFTMNDAVSIFGARAGPDMFAAMREGRFDIEGLADEIANGSDTIRGAAEDTYDWREALQQLTNRGMLLLEPAAVRVFDALTGLVNVGLDVSETFSEEGLAGVLRDLRDGFADMTGPMQAFIGLLGVATIALVAFRVAALIAWAAAFAPVIAAAAPVLLILGALGLAIALLVRGFGPFVEKIRGAIGAVGRLGGVLERGRDLMVGIAGGAIATLRRAWNSLATATEGGRRVMADALAAVGRAFGRLGEASRRGRQIIGDALATVVRFFRELPGKVLGAIARLPGQLGNAGRAAIRGLREGISSAFGAVMDFFRGIPGRLVGAIPNPGGMLYSIGRQIMQGLLNGLQSLADSVRGFISDLAGDIAGGISGALGIGSPSKVMHQLGEYTMEGFRLGMEREWARTAAWLRTVNPAVEVQEGDFGFARRSPTASRVTSSQALTARVTLDVTGADQDLVRMVRKMVRVRGGDVQVVLGS